MIARTKSCFHWDISCYIPIGAHVLACAVLILHIWLSKQMEQLKATVSLENIVGNIYCEDHMKMTSAFRLDTITL